MSQIVHLTDGTAIKNDVVASFNRAVKSEDNLKFGFKSTDFWNFVHADMYFDLSHVNGYRGSYIDECFDKLAEELV
tara:strand:+ start:9509 stop:9736 length:228 start_codon:yes stop_codon:yes gene_type:complete